MEGHKIKYIKVEWPEVQEYMNKPAFRKDAYFDAPRNVWFIPEYWYEKDSINSHADICSNN